MNVKMFDFDETHEKSSENFRNFPKILYSSEM